MLHGTIRQTVIKLKDHRGDRGAHGRDGPEPHELRYLLFSICTGGRQVANASSAGTAASAPYCAGVRPWFWAGIRSAGSAMGGEAPAEESPGMFKHDNVFYRA